MINQKTDTNAAQVAEIWQQYEKGREYKESVSLYSNVTRNENFFIGRQWEGLSAPDIDKPVFNILKRVVTYFVSTIVSDDVSAQVSTFGNNDGLKNLGFITQAIDRVFERTRIKTKNRDAVRNAAVDGDACFHLYFNPDCATGQKSDGDIEVEVIENTDVYFGNPSTPEVERQPYIIIAAQRAVDDVKSEMRAHGASEEEISKIAPDPDLTQEHTGKVTVLTRYQRKGQTVWCSKATRSSVIRPEFDTGYRLYPVAYFSWDKIRGSYHGQSVVTGLIPNQIIINKTYAMAAYQVKMMSFPKIVYDKTRLREWNNRVGEAIGVNGPPNDILATVIRGADMSPQVMQLINSVLRDTRDLMGASDAALGNVKPDNTSAIIAVQKSTTVPLELQKMSFYQFVEDYVRIMLDIMAEDYGIRRVENPAAPDHMQSFDFSQLRELYLRLNIEIGASSYWSELMQVHTVDNLFARGIITDPILYLESIPDGYIKGKHRIISALKAEREPQAAEPAIELTDSIY